jgi:cyclophilin family peptidyl-prolyl cis-trans isomerase/HEAT repeat protein
LLALLVVSCAPPTPPAPPPPAQRPPEPRRLVIGEDEIAAFAELLRAEDRRALDSARIASLFRHALPEVRERAALAAGRIGDPRASDLLIGMLDDTVPSVGAHAAFALGLLRDTSSTIVYALGRKLAAGWSDDDERAVEAVATFGRLGTPAAHAALRQVLQRYVPPDAGNGNGNRAAPVEPLGAAGLEALLAIWRFPRPETSVDLVIPHLASSDDEVRWRATYALSRMGSPRSVAALRDRLADSNPLVRSLAARGLRAPAVDSALQRPQTTVALIAALADPHPHVQINAAGSIATFTDSTLAPALGVVLTSPDANVRLAGTQALALLGGGAATDTLLRIARQSSERLVVRSAALSGLLRLAARRGVAEVADWITSEDWLTRLYAARALAGAPWTDASRSLRRLAEDRDARVATAAIRAITSATDSLTAPYTLYIQALASHDPSVRAAATAGLSRRGSPADLSALMEAYDRAQRDTVNTAAVAALDALISLERRGVPVERAFFLRFRPSPDREVRARAVRHFGPQGWGTDTLPAERDAAFYESVVRDLVVPDLTEDKRPQAAISTPTGTIVIELAAANAPLTVHNFITLSTSGFYPGRSSESRFRWHRVVPNFVLQDGDPRGDGGGGPGHAIRDEINRLRYGRGMVGMALSGPNTGGSQFFITHSPQPHLDGGYTIFGRIIAGMEAADRVVQDDPIHSVEITR